MGTLTAIFSLLALLGTRPDDEPRAQALLEEYGPGYRVMETVAYRYVLPLDGERYVGTVMTPIEATYDRFHLDTAKLGWNLARLSEKPEIVMFTDESRWRAHLERLGYQPEDGFERLTGRVYLYDLGTTPEHAGKTRSARLALNISQATRAAARQLWYASGFLAREHDYPAWLEEGLAIALERDATHESASLFHDGRRTRLATLNAAEERELDLPYASWIDGGEADLLLEDLARPSLRAAQAWSLVRQLVETRRAALPEYVSALEQGLPPAEARARSLGSPEELEAGRRLARSPR